MSKTERGRMDTDNSVVIWGEGKVGIRGMDGNGKNTIKISYYLKKLSK